NGPGRHLSWFQVSASDYSSTVVRHFLGLSNPLRSKRFPISAGSISTFAPLSGTSTWALQSIALVTSRREFSLDQFLRVCPPVKPKGGPPGVRSKADATTSSRRGYFLESADRRASSGGVATRIGVRFFLSCWNLMLKYHSSRILNGCTPRVIEWSGSFLK